MKHHLSSTGALFAAMPPLIVLVLFYSLAVHMHLNLGGWPHSIGFGGFSPGLLLHAKVQFWGAQIIMLMSMYLWPVGTVVSAVHPKARWLLPYLGIFALAVIVCYGLAQLAPEPFLYWWRD